MTVSIQKSDENYIQFSSTLSKKNPDFELLFYNQASFKTDLAELFISENQNVHAKDDLEISYYD